MLMFTRRTNRKLEERDTIIECPDGARLLVRVVEVQHDGKVRIALVGPPEYKIDRREVHERYYGKTTWPLDERFGKLWSWLIRLYGKDLVVTAWTPREAVAEVAQYLANNGIAEWPAAWTAARTAIHRVDSTETASGVDVGVVLSRVP